MSCSLTADHLHRFLLQKIVEQAHGIRPSPYTGDQVVRQTPCLQEYLTADFLTDDFLEIAHHGGKRMRSHDRSQHIVGVLHLPCPFAHGFVHGILERPGTRHHRMNRCTKKTHPVDIQSLPLTIDTPHEHFALQAQQGGNGGGSHTMLSGSCFSNDAFLAHIFRQQALSEHIVDLMRACMVQILALEVDVGTAQVTAHIRCIGQQAWPPGIVGIQLGQFCLEAGIVLPPAVGLLQFQYCRHQSFGDVLPTIDSKSSFLHSELLQRSIDVSMHRINRDCPFFISVSPI
ncbi:hypothetical protein SDC9_134029 [bioreactor metagenome]|uniref:Uncharacterized protein n=1 Tax=bioreactor metagenome TaxID=1076179 RepID=A0A645DBW0_9ZZZZ